MSTVIFNEDVFYDACVEEIINENTVKLTIRLDDDKVISSYYLFDLDDTKVKNFDTDVKDIFLTDLLNLMIPIGSFVKVKIHQKFVTIFSKKLDKNINSIFKVIKNSNATYKL